MGTVIQGRPRVRTVALAFVAGTVALSVPTVVLGGSATTHPNGNFLMIDVNVRPPRADSGATIRYNAFFGNRRGAVLPREARNTIRLAKGFRLMGHAFPRCPLPREASEFGAERCPQQAKVGEGTFEADARPALAEPVKGGFQVYNGERHDGRATLILLAQAEIGSTTFRSEVDYQYAGSTLRSLPPPEGTATGLYSVTKVFLKIGAKRHGKSFVKTPRECRGSWRFLETSFFESGGSISARSTAPCVRR